MPNFASNILVNVIRTKIPSLSILFSSLVLIFVWVLVSSTIIQNVSVIVFVVVDKNTAWEVTFATARALLSSAVHERNLYLAVSSVQLSLKLQCVDNYRMFLVSVVVFLLLLSLCNHNSIDMRICVGPSSLSLTWSQCASRAMTSFLLSSRNVWRRHTISRWRNDDVKWDVSQWDKVVVARNCIASESSEWCWGCHDTLSPWRRVVMSLWHDPSLWWHVMTRSYHDDRSCHRVVMTQPVVMVTCNDRLSPWRRVVSLCRDDRTRRYGV